VLGHRFKNAYDTFRAVLPFSGNVASGNDVEACISKAHTSVSTVWQTRFSSYKLFPETEQSERSETFAPVTRMAKGSPKRIGNKMLFPAHRLFSIILFFISINTSTALRTL
jgi:hypothetical protein